MTEQSSHAEPLKRHLKPRHLQLIALGGIIGSGYFLGTSYVIQQAGPATSIAYLLGGLLVLCVMLCLGELSVAAPLSGSFITYTYDFVSPSWACGVGWSYWLTWMSYVPSEMIAGGIILHSFIPEISATFWAVILGGVITLLNLSNVGTFGEVEFWLSLTKIFAIVLFVGLSLFILLGGRGPDSASLVTPPVVTPGFFSYKELVPQGAWSVILTMVIILVNFQGSEIIGLAAGESKNPAKSIPTSVRNIVWRIVSLYVVPLVLLIAIYPWEKATLNSCVFSDALGAYGFRWAAGIFTFVVLVAAISCSNSGLYGSVRAVYALAQEGMAPRWLCKLNKNHVPQNATIASLAGCWVGVLIYTLDGSKGIYVNLLALSGFTGAIAWISICWAQLKFRKKLMWRGVDLSKLVFKTPLFPYLTYFAIWAQVACLIIIVFNPDLRISFYLGVPLVLIPVVWYKLWGSRIQPVWHERVHYSQLFVSTKVPLPKPKEKDLP